jgi:hypothetical protein
MSTTTTTKRPKSATRRAGYLIAVVVNAVLLYLVNRRPGWEVLPFLTGDMAKVLPLINLSLAAGIAVNLVYVVHDPRWLVAAGQLVTIGTGLVAMVRMWQVFPFELGPGWTTTVRVLLLLGLAGSLIAIVVQIVTLIAVGREPPVAR